MALALNAGMMTSTFGEVGIGLGVKGLLRGPHRRFYLLRVAVARSVLAYTFQFACGRSGVQTASLGALSHLPMFASVIRVREPCLLAWRSE